MPRLIFDIETIGVEFESLDKTSKEFLLEFAESDEEEQKIKEELGFSPLTGEVVAIGIINPDTEKGTSEVCAWDHHAYFAVELKLSAFSGNIGQRVFIPLLGGIHVLRKLVDLGFQFFDVERRV